MARKTLITFFVIVLTIAQVVGQKPSAGSFKIVFYNVENLFDTIDDPAKQDEDFLPSAKVPWTQDRYRTKLSHIARVITAIDSTNLPAVIGLAEVENRAVLEDLTKKSGLARGKYEIVHQEGSDPRGIDVALLYRPQIVKLLGFKSFPSATTFQTRHVLWVQLQDQRRNIYHVFVNHWKSRSGGATETEPQRIENATILKHVVDSLRTAITDANIIILGDLNDEPANESIAKVLGAQAIPSKPTAGSLYNLMYKRYSNGEGTLYYKDWDLFDQIIVSGNLITRKQGKGAVIKSPYAYIFKKDFLLYKNKSGEMVPNRTAGSREYFGGYSDHLPVYTIVNF